jgi:endoglycosylceramidase
VVIVHGVNMVYKVPPYYPAAIGFDRDDAAFLARLGFRAVRVGVIWKALEPRPGVYDDHYLARISRTVTTLAHRGILSLLDFHQDMYNERFQGEGAPEWAVQDDGLPPIPKEGFPANYELMPALQHAYDHFWANSPGPRGVGLQDRFAAAWRHVAHRLHGNPHVLGYELFNEPFPGSTWPTCANPAGCPSFDAMLTAFTKRLVAAIRSADRRHLIWYEPNVIFDFGADTNLGPIGDRRAGFAFHDYCLEAGTSGSTTSCAGTEDRVVVNAVHHVQQTRDALLMTEFGDDNYSLLAAMVQRDDRNMVPWLEWSYCPCHDPTGAADKNAVMYDPGRRPAGRNRNLAALQILVEPYPQVVSGTPRSWTFDSATRTFTFSFSTTRAGGHGRFRTGALTEIATPAFVYRGRYAVRPRGRSRGSCRAPARAAPHRGSR